MELNTISKGNKDNLRSRVINAGGWVALVFIFGQILRFGSNLILTRLLVPEMFGVMVIVTVVQIGLTMFSDVGLLQNVVQSRRGEERLFLNTVWVVQIVRGCLLFLCMLILSWLLVVAGDAGWLPDGSVYADPILPVVLAVMGLNVLFAGMSSTKRYAAVREMTLARVSLLDLGSQFFGIIVMIALAWQEPNIWALVIGSLVTSVSAAILSHAALPGKNNRIQWDSSAFHEIFHFGKWVFLSSIVGFLVNQGDRLLLGGVISAAMLGVYSIAFFLASAVKLLLEKVNGMVFFSALSEVARNRPEDLARTYYKIRWRIDGVVFLVAGCLFVSGSTVVELLYDARYHEAGWMLQALSILLISVGYSVSEQCFLALGKAKFVLGVKITQALFLFGALLPAFSIFGLTGAVFVIALAPLLGSLVAWWPMHKLGLLRIFRELMMLPMLIVGILLGLSLNYMIN